MSTKTVSANPNLTFHQRRLSERIRLRKRLTNACIRGWHHGAAWPVVKPSPRAILNDQDAAAYTKGYELGRTQREQSKNFAMLVAEGMING